MKSVLRHLRVLIPMSAAVVALIVTAFTWQDQDDYYFKVNKGLELFGQVYREIAGSYVDEVDPDEFIAAGIQGMLKTLDPYTIYMRRKESADIDLLTNGTYGGIGITVGLRDSVVTIVDVVDGYSAQREGVRIGDRILAINGVTLLKGPLEALREHTRGEPSTTLSLTVLRDGAEEPLSFTLTRENIKVHSVSYSGLIDSRTGYIKLDRFGTTAGDEVRNAILEMRRDGLLNGLILDLRDNPGGLLESAVDVASKFVPAGSVIVTTRGRDSSDERTYRSSEQPIAADVPLVILMNENSASAAEIVAGAIQDLDAGVIMGTSSYGKGLVQSVRRLPYDATLKMTTARYFTPSGRSIQKIDYKDLREHHADAVAQHTLFRTRHGRPVYERGGIVPDSTVAGPDTNTIVEQLARGSVFFNFATRYTSGLSSLPANFRVDEAVMKQFEAFAMKAATNGSIANPTIAKLRELQATARQARLGSGIQGRLADLEQEIVAEQNRMLAADREAVRRYLYGEIVGRFGDQRSRARVWLDGDRQILTAMGLIRTGAHDYDRLLSVR